MRELRILIQAASRHRQVACDAFGVLLAERLQLVSGSGRQVTRRDLVGQRRIRDPRRPRLFVTLVAARSVRPAVTTTVIAAAEPTAIVTPAEPTAIVATAESPALIAPIGTAPVVVATVAPAGALPAIDAAALLAVTAAVVPAPAVGAVSATRRAR